MLKKHNRETFKRICELFKTYDLAKKSNLKQWDTMFEKLVDFKKQFNHCNVSSRYHDKKLANWVKTQRVAFKTGKIREDRYNRLIEIRFKF